MIFYDWSNIYLLYYAKYQYPRQGEEKNRGKEFNRGCPSLEKKG
jgi:hypothetical protein